MEEVSGVRGMPRVWRDGESSWRGTWDIQPREDWGRSEFGEWREMRSPVTGGASQVPQRVCPASLELLPPTRRLRQGQIPGPSEEESIDHIITDSGQPGLKSEVPLLHFFPSFSNFLMKLK